jgi:hypothetical protein
VLVVAALIAGLSALLLGVMFPYGGRAAAAAVYVSGTVFLVEIAGLAFWSGWLITFVAAEAWIRHTRHGAGAAALSAPVSVAAD